MGDQPGVSGNVEVVISFCDRVTPSCLYCIIRTSKRFSPKLWEYSTWTCLQVEGLRLSCHFLRSVQLKMCKSLVILANHDILKTLRKSLS